ncbi:MAG: GTPase Era [bacterium]|jgi:GTP-binding protein Era
MGTFACGYVAVAGRPNVGKSTLTNKLLNFPLSIVTRKPQTTRQRLLGILTGEEYQVIFLDTPGMLVPRYALQKVMNEAAWAAVEDADVVLLLTEPVADDFDGETNILDRLRKLGKKVILAINKIDLISKPSLLPLTEHFMGLYPFEEIVPVSALKSDGLDILKQAIIAALPEQAPFYPPDEITDKPMRFFAGEIVRQKVFELYGEEIPYSVAAVVDEYKEREGSKDYIRVDVIAERDTQKAILIGRKGEAVKKLGRAAREAIEAFVGKPVFLEIRVQVRKNWRKDENSARRYGHQ